MPSTFDRLLDRPVRTDKVRLAYLPDDAEKLNAARQALNLAKMAAEQSPEDDLLALKVREAQEEHDELEQSMLTVTFHMAGIGPKRVERMLADPQYKATPKQEKEARAANNGKPQNLQWNEDTFPPALIAAVTTSVEMSDSPDEAMDALSEVQAVELWAANWSVGDRALLFMTALALDQASSQVEELGKD